MQVDQDKERDKLRQPRQLLPDFCRSSSLLLSLAPARAERVLSRAAGGVSLEKNRGMSGMSSEWHGDEGKPWLPGLWDSEKKTGVVAGCFR